HECLSGARPFDGSGLLEYVGSLRRAPRPLRAVVPSAPPSLELVVTRALERDPLRRFPDAGAFARALAKAGAPASRRTTPLLLLGALLAAGAVVAGALALRGAKAPPPPRRVETVAVATKEPLADF